MATIIKAHCTNCDTEVVLAPESFHLFIMDTGKNHYYVFCCPACTELCRRDASPAIVTLLQAGGVPSTDVHVPLEILEIEACAPAPKLTNDDLLDFVKEMAEWSGEGLV